MSEPTSRLYERFLELLTPGAGPDGPAHRAGGREPARARYGERVDGEGRTHPVLITRDAWILDQIDLALAFDQLLTADDVVVVAAPYELSFVGAGVDRAIEMIGASVISVGTSNTICPMPRLLGLIEEYGATALVCSPSLAAELASLAGASERPLDRSSVRSVICVGEACSRERLDRIGAAWAARARALYGTPSAPTVAVPCAHGALHVCDHRLRASVRDVPGGRTAPEGPRDGAHPGAVARGELLLTAPDTDPAGDGPGATGELVELGGADRPCPCGEKSAVLTPLGRVTEAVPARRGPVSAVDVERVVFDRPDLAPHFACQVRNGGFDVTCAVTDGDAVRDGEVKRSLEKRVREELDVDVEVRIVAVDDWNTAVS
ncbi:AMP-binding protein [Streptomyces sp. NRRL B-1347]|uniref:AMP-binding protein n=1 Tax=Streptomyces sp. NRRL B-1347 TaxID=1476877 RepID=UPI000AF43604|nr:AMP-binding protein [Streptomyces sp. NRRL B-1347]